MSIRRQSIHSIHNKKFWTEFFYLYESLPALWDMNNPLYKNRQVKCDAYDIMVDKLREIEPNADREDVLRKINIFRTNYRRECSRINMSLQEGRHYQSTLWYFDLLCFLQTADTRRDRKRKLMDDDGEKSIMRKRRPNHMMQKSSDQFIVPTKKDHLIEYQPHSSHAFDYDLNEEADFDYVPDDLGHAFVDDKSDTTSEIPQNHDYQEEDDETDQNHQEYNHQLEYENYTLQRSNSIHDNNPKVELIVNHVTQLTNEIVSSDAKLEINNEDQDQDQENFHEYASQEKETIHTAQWCIKTANVENIIPSSQQKQEQSSINTIHISDNGTGSSTSNKFVRDVKTMTSAKPNGCCSKISESSEILAKSWAIQLDELTHEQKLLARKAINDILFEACMGHLVIGPNGHVTTNSCNDYNNLNAPKNHLNQEFESSEIYEQLQMTTSMPASTSTPAVTSAGGGGNNVALTISASEASTSKIHRTDEWLKL